MADPRPSSLGQRERAELIDPSRSDVSSAGRARPRRAEERRARRDRHPCRLRARGQGDQAAADVDSRGLRIVRDARARRVRGPGPHSPRGLHRSWVRRRRLDHARDGVLAKRVARGRCDGSRRLWRSLLRLVQRVLRGSNDGSAPHVRPAGDDPRAELCDSGPARGLGSRDRCGDLRRRTALAAPPARRPSAGRRPRPAGRRGSRRREPRAVRRSQP